MKETIKSNDRFFIVPVEILETDLNINEKMVYMVLRSFVNPHDNQAFPSHATIAKMASVSKTTVIRALNSLIDKGYVQREHKFNYDHIKKTARQTSNVYTLVNPKDVEGVSHRHGGGVPQTWGGVSHRHTKNITRKNITNITI